MFACTESSDSAGQRAEGKGSLGEALKGYLVGLAEAVWGQAEQGPPWEKAAEASNTTNVQSAHLSSLAP